MVREEELAKYLTRCPLCKSSASFKIYGFPFKKNVECKSCGAKWKWENSDRVLLEEYSKDGTGDFLLKVERTATFWSNLNLEDIDWERVPIPQLVIVKTLVLEIEEEVLAGWEGSSDALSGVLVLTTKRLMWLERREVVEGLLRRKSRVSYHLAYSLLLEDLVQILSSPSRLYPDSEDVEMRDTNGKKYCYKLGRMKEYPSCKPLIMKGIEKRRKEMESEKRRERVKVVLDFSSLKEYMESGGLVMQTFRCPNCGAPVEFPEKGKTTKCSHCSAKIYARDIFEKIRELIG